MTVQELWIDYQLYVDAKLFESAKETLKEIVKKRFGDKASQDVLDKMFADIDNLNLNENVLVDEFGTD